MHHFLRLPYAELAYVMQYGYAAFFALFLVGELVGFLPLGLLLVAMGALARQHLFHFSYLLALAILANVLANFALYSLARKLGKQQVYQERIKDSRLAARIEKHMQEHPALTIFVTRFIGVASHPTTLIAGLFRVPRSIFISAIALGNGICCFVYLSVGYFVGGAWEHDARTASRITLLIVGVVLVGYILYYLISKLRSLPTRP
jgi:membrane protein DedA with SNARE-associated domain